ncbi:MAG: GTP-binding protein, partial [Candidatus Sungbacteria bacterium]|nr:GTP-binding protein [Candidatus Sungbacteria bacterium]
TFIDTPGHEAFKEMRSRGAVVADIGVLVVAADEGVKPQTKEAIQILKTAEIPFVVAINKIDRLGKDVELVKKELSENEVQVESWGGKVPSIELSAKTGENVEELIETLLLVADVEHFTGNPHVPAEAVVVESHRDPKRGATATLLIRDGKIERGNFIVIDGAASPVKILEDFLGKSVEAAGPSQPVRIAGLVEVPGVGSAVKTFLSKAEAETYAAREKKTERAALQEIKAGKTYINVILKTDVSGSKEAIEGTLQNMQLEDIGIRLIRSEVGDINDSDVQLALSSTNVVVIGFRVKFPSHLAEVAKNNGIQVISAEIIYDLFDQLKAAVQHLIPAEIREVLSGKLKVLKFFKQEKSKQIVGGRVTEGVVHNGEFFRIVRKGVGQGKGKIANLQIRRQAAAETAEGNECGLLVEADLLIAEGDVLEVYKEERIERSF